MALATNILKELQEISPTVAAIEPVTPYKVPDGYFENLAQLVITRIQELETPSASQEIKMLSPLLDGLKNKMPYTVPEGYFKNLISGHPLQIHLRRNLHP